MTYSVPPVGSVWASGFFFVPVSICENLLKMSSEYQIKALLIVLSKNGTASLDEISKALGVTQSDAEEFMQFWVSEGVLINSDAAAAPPPAKEQPPAACIQKPCEPAEKMRTKSSAASAPSLSPKDIVNLCRENDELQYLLKEAQSVLGRTISRAEQEMFINMSTFYGLPVSVILMIIQHYKAQKEKGRALGMSYIAKMAANWADEGITSISEAEEKLAALDKSDEIWKEIAALAGIRHKAPTAKMRAMTDSWVQDFSMEMIELACVQMKEHTEKASLSYVNSILKNWKKKGILTPEDYEKDCKKFEETAKNASSTKLKSTPTYDIEKIKSDAMNNTEI